MLLQEAGATPEPDGLLNTPEQMLMQESGGAPHFSSGGISPQDMMAALMAQNKTPQHFWDGGSVLKNVGTQAAFSLPFIPEDARSIAASIKQEKYPEAATQTAGSLYSMFAPFNPLTALISGLTYTPEVGDATLDAWLAQKEAEKKAAQQPKTVKQDKHNIIPFTETRFYKK